MRLGSNRIIRKCSSIKITPQLFCCLFWDCNKIFSYPINSCFQIALDCKLWVFLPPALGHILASHPLYHPGDVCMSLWREQADIRGSKPFKTLFVGYGASGGRFLLCGGCDRLQCFLWLGFLLTWYFNYLNGSLVFSPCMKFPLCDILVVSVQQKVSWGKD